LRRFGNGTVTVRFQQLPSVVLDIDLVHSHGVTLLFFDAAVDAAIGVAMLTPCETASLHLAGADGKDAVLDGVQHVSAGRRQRHQLSREQGTLIPSAAQNRACRAKFPYTESCFSFRSSNVTQPTSQLTNTRSYGHCQCWLGANWPLPAAARSLASAPRPSAIIRSCAVVTMLASSQCNIVIRPAAPAARMSFT
jgi:hypothetical protein